MRPIFVTLVTFFILFFDSQIDAHADTEAQSTAKFELNIVAPKYLYHWTDLDGLNAMANSSRGLLNSGNGYFYHAFASQLFKTTLIETIEIPDDGFREIFRVDHDMRLLYTWTDPVGGIGSWAGLYPENRNQHFIAPDIDYDSSNRALLRLSIDREKARVIKIIVDNNHPWGDLNDSQLIGSKAFNLVEYDLVDFTYMQGGKIVLREWVILNQKIVTSYTADPRKMTALSSALTLLKDPSYVIPEKTLHAGNHSVLTSNHGRKAAIEAIEDYLSGRKRDQIPPVFLGRKSVALRCEKLF